MRELKRVPVSSLKPDPDQTRKRFDEAEILSLAEGIKKDGQQVPVIADQVEVADRERSK